MRTSLKCTVVAIAALGLVACGSSSNKRSRRSTRSVAASASVDTLLNAGWSKFSQFKYLCSTSSDGCLSQSHPDYWHSPTHDDPTMVPTTPTEHMEPMIDEATYKAFARCVLTADGDYNPGNLSISFSNSGLSNSDVERKAQACCDANKDLTSMTSGMYGEITPPVYTGEDISTTGLSTGEALMNFASRELLSGNCYPTAPEPGSHTY